MTDPTSPPRLPHEPPLLTATLPSLGGHIGQRPEDFAVDEIPAYLPSGSGDHRYVHVRKRELSTPELVSILSRAAAVQERDVGYAGLKDKHAITTQWLSLPRRSRAVAEWKLPESVVVLEESYHTNKLRTGHLHGNHFSLRLCQLDDDAEARLPALVAAIGGSILNAFGEQRFGRGGHNIDSAWTYLTDPRSIRGKNARFLSKLLPSVLQAELFNRYLTRRLERGLDRLLLGEVVRLEGSGSNFIVEDLKREQARYERGEVHPQGPMFGPKMRACHSAALELESEVLAELALLPEQLARLGDAAPGTRRDIWLRLDDLRVCFENDEQGKRCLRLEFSLPAGGYATQVVREFSHSAWLGTSGPRRSNPAKAVDFEDDDSSRTA